MMHSGQITPDLLANCAARYQPGHRPFLAAIVGSLHAGKTTRLKMLFDACEFLPRGGFAEIACFDGEVRLGYDFVDLRTGQRVCVARRQSEPQEDGCRYAFFPEAWTWADACLRQVPEGGIAFVDELGILEAANGGLWDALMTYMARGKAAAVVACVREDISPAIAKALGGFDYTENLGR
ncbi:MAG: hypothetical protein FWC40_07695 [Proteobacteria bacterium]|nr:hypothetical protein [Pseudomonadota bacterium]